MSVLFLNLPAPSGFNLYRDYYGGFGSAFCAGAEARNVFPPLFDAYAAAVLETQGFDVDVVDAQAEELSTFEVLQEVRLRSPEVVVSRISLPSFKSDALTLSRIKKSFPKTTLAGWGSICKAKPEHVLLNSSIDVAIRDELEFAVLELAKVLQKGHGLNSVKGLSFKASRAIFHSPSRPIQDLETLPLPACHLLNMSKYVAQESYFFREGSKFKQIPFFTMMSSRGCSSKCIYCPYPSIFGPWRGMSVRRTIDEIEFLSRRHGVPNIWFRDPTFTMVPKRTLKLCREIGKRELGITWVCETRADRLPRSLIRAMKEAGCSRIQLGIETGDPELLWRIGKRGCSIENFKRTMRLVKDEGILIEANFIVGLPGESWKAVRKTGELIRRTDPDDVTISVLTPFPGTPLSRMNNWSNRVFPSDYCNGLKDSQPQIVSSDFSNKDALEAKEYLYSMFTCSRALREIYELAGKESLKDLARKVASSFPKICLGGYWMVKSALKSGLAWKQKESVSGFTDAEKI